MKSCRLRLTLIFSILFTTVFAQVPKEFPSDDAAFVKALGDFVASNNRPEAKLLGANFQRSYLLATNTPEQIATAKHIAGVLLQKKAPLYPNFYNYTQLLLTTTTTQHPANLVKQHLENLDKIISSDSKEAQNQFNTYLAYLQALFYRHSPLSRQSKEMGNRWSLYFINGRIKPRNEILQYQSCWNYYQ